MVDARAELKKYKQEIDNTLHEILKNVGVHDGTIPPVITYNMFPGGKRLRPLLTLLIYKALKGTQGTIMHCACVPELIHIATLMLDDLPCMDNSDLRRGQPTSHKKFGEADTILVAFGLITHAFHVLSDKKNIQGVDARDVVALHHAISNKIGLEGLIGGQVADLNSGKNLLNCTNDAEKIELITYHKTANLFEVCALIATTIAQASTTERDRYLHYAKNVGMTLQLADDIQDVDEDMMLSYPKAHGIEHTKELLNGYAKEASACITEDNETAELLRAIPRILAEKIA